MAIPSAYHAAEIGSTYAAARLPVGEFDRESAPFEDFHHGHSGLRPQSFDEAGDEELDDGGFGAHG